MTGYPRDVAAVQAGVVVIGGGPAGLVAAHCLGMWNVRTVLVERREEAPKHPQATMINVRTTEILRLLGLTDSALRHSVELDSSARVSFVSTVSGPEIGRIEIVDSANKLMRMAEQSPTLPTICAQNRLQDDLAKTLVPQPNVEVFRGCSATGVETGEETVEVTVEDDTGTPSKVIAEYAVLAEGLRGGLREQVGIGDVTAPPLGRLLDIYFTADLREFTRGRESVLYWILNPSLRAVLITVAPEDGEWLLEVPALGGSDDDYLFEPSCDYAGLLTEALGVEVEPTIHSVRSWSMGSTIADRFVDGSGRVAVIGDAAHTFPPTGGFGMNTGVQDAHNLCWKLAGAVRGWASPSILHTYELERRPVAHFNAAQSEHNALKMRDFLEYRGGQYAETLRRGGPEAERARSELAPAIEEQRPHFDFYGQALGFRYPVSRSEPGPVVSDVVNYAPTVTPGARAPHCWLRDNSGRKISTLDISARAFALFAEYTHGSGWGEAVRQLRHEREIPIRACLVTDTTANAGKSGDTSAGISTHTSTEVSAGVSTGGLADPEGDLIHEYGLRGSRAVLVRPDGHVAALLEGTAPVEELSHALDELVTHDRTGGRKNGMSSEDKATAEGTTAENEHGLSQDQIDDLLSGDRYRVRRASAQLSTDELRHHLRTPDGEAGLREAFALMPSYYVPGHLEEPLVVRWKVARTPANPVEFDLFLDNESCRAREVSETSEPAVELVMDAASFVEIASGATRGKTLLMRGDLKVRGDVQVAMRMETLFGLDAREGS